MTQDTANHSSSYVTLPPIVFDCRDPCDTTFQHLTQRHNSYKSPLQRALLLIRRARALQGTLVLLIRVCSHVEDLKGGAGWPSQLLQASRAHALE